MPRPAPIVPRFDPPRRLPDLPIAGQDWEAQLRTDTEAREPDPPAPACLPNHDPFRVGDWMQTFTGRCFWPLDPRAEEIEIEDIAHALAMTCRYNGHTMRFYSVAEHSVLVSQHVPPAVALWGLLHDAAEAYSADLVRPLKRCLPDWAPLEARIMQAVCVRFGLPAEEPAIVKQIDYAMTSDERAALMAPCQRDWGELPPAVGAVIRCLTPPDAMALFMARFDEVTDATVYGR